MSTMGIFVLITLILALNLHQALDAGSQVHAESESVAYEIDPARKQELERRQATLQVQYDQLYERTRELTDVIRDSSELDQDAKLLLEQFEQLKALSEQVNQILASEDIGNFEELQERKAELAMLEKTAMQLRTSVEKARLNPRLTYIVQDGFHKQPLLVELSDSRFGIGTPSDPTNAIWLTERRISTRMDTLLSWAGRNDHNGVYFVILLKPSGFEVYDHLVDRLKGHGFDVGTELIRESDSVLVKP